MTKMLFAAPVIAAVLLSGSAFAATAPAAATSTKPAATSTAKAKPAHVKHHKKTEDAKKPA